MEIASGGKNKAAFEPSLKFIPALAYQFGNERVILARVRRPDDVCNAVLDRHLRHRARNFERLRAVVKPRKYVAMNVNHLSGSITQAQRDDNDVTFLLARNSFVRLAKSLQGTR
jgi:hypothetical protein